MLNNSGLSVTHYDNLLEGWASQTLKPNVDFGASNLFYCTGETARTNLISTFNWFITDGGKKCISLFDGPTTTTPEILNGQPQVIDYGSTSTSKSRSFTLSNNQGTVITNVMVVNPGSGFPTSLVFPTILAGATQTFTVDLTGPVGTYTETVTITSPDFPGSFQFNVSGEVTATPEPEIAAFEGTTVLGTQNTGRATSTCRVRIRSKGKQSHGRIYHHQYWRCGFKYFRHYIIRICLYPCINSTNINTC
jgi:hypothetical protein